MRNWPQTVLSQYADSPRLLALLGSIDDWISPDADFEAFYDLIWNVDTAQGYGLDVWGRIVNVSRVLVIAAGDYFGFTEATDAFGFGESPDAQPFYAGQPVTTNYILTDEVYRRLILAKAATNITDGSIPAINQILLNLFQGRGNCWVTDGRNVPESPYFGFAEMDNNMVEGFGQQPFDDLTPAYPSNMTLTYVFQFPLEPFEIAMVLSGVLPKPVGVLASVSHL